MNKGIRISIFLVPALAWSFLYFWQRPFSEELAKLPPILSVFAGLMPALGLFAMGILMGTQLKEKQFGLLGKGGKWSFLIALVPIICLTAFGIPNQFGVQSNMFGFIIGLNVLLYAFLEEVGWRGYLQEEFLGKNNKWLGYLIIGSAWYLWHWFFLRAGNDPKLLLLPVLIVASAGIGEIAKSTKSVLVCAAFHSLGNILIMYNLIAKNLETQSKFIIAAICIMTWLPMLKKIEEAQRKYHER